jgi:hypothetical protein
MKKQLLIAAVAATMTSAAMADISIAGDAKFEYFNTDASTTEAVASTNTEVNIKITAKNGDTTVVLNNEFNSSAAAGAGMDTEDMYMTTKIGDISVKAGNYASATSALLGEIDEGGRAQDKVSLSTSMGGIKIAYAVAEAGAQLNSDAAAVSISGKVAGFNVAVKDDSDSYTGYGISGDVAGFGVRLEQKNSDTANSDVTFGNVTREVNGVTLGYAFLDADTTGLIGESDGIFVAAANGTTTTGATQVTLATTVAGNTVNFRTGTLENGIAAGTDLDFTKLTVTRALAAGSTLELSLKDVDTSATASTETFEAQLSVKF